MVERMESGTFSWSSRESGKEEESACAMAAKAVAVVVARRARNNLGEDEDGQTGGEWMEWRRRGEAMRIRRWK